MATHVPYHPNHITVDTTPHIMDISPSSSSDTINSSTAATLYEQLVIIGGMQDESTVNSIHQLVDGQWVKIGSMSCYKERCLVVSPSPDRMMIVGGWKAEDSVEECIVLS